MRQLHPLSVLRASAARLRSTVERLDGGQLIRPSYAREWTIAGVLSHLGSGAVIMIERIDAAIQQREMAADFATGVWDEWNAKAPPAQATDALAADQALIDRIDGISPAERATFSMSLGPLSFDVDGTTNLRLNEHVLHSWDIAVAIDPTAVLPADGAALVVDNLGLVARYTARPTGTVQDISVHTDEPDRDFTISLATDAVTFASGAAAPSEPQLVMPAEAFIRLIYGRLDAEHAPSTIVDGRGVLEVLRKVFSGV